MEFKLTFEPELNGLNLSHNDSIVSIGSCFSEEIAKKMSKACFDVNSNPFGTLFHPEALLNVLNSSIDGRQDVEVLKRDDLFFSWDASSKIYASSEEELTSTVRQLREKLKTDLADAKLLIITFGTAWKYTHKELHITVGNCHKEQKSQFDKTLASFVSMEESWQRLLKKMEVQFPNLQVLFSVSPVRHAKDGLVENNRSKARLIELVHSLVEKNGNCSYFPAYEIVIDELRDYRFYSEDLVHPNSQAINYIWERFSASSMSFETKVLLKIIRKIKATLSHKSLHPNSKVNSQRLDIAIADKERLLQEHPFLKW